MFSPLFSLILLFHVIFCTALPALTEGDGQAVSPKVYESLEELARIVDIAYCVGSTGIQKPFFCLSRCSDFVGFELLSTWNTGPLLSDSCGYIALSHAPHQKRVIIAFRGTYSIANTIADLSTIPAEYAPFPAKDGEDNLCTQIDDADQGSSPAAYLLKQDFARSESDDECHNCTVHSGFMTSWRNARCAIIPHIERALKMYPDYELTLVGHSLGGAVAAIAGLEFQARGWNPHITTFGEPRVGNLPLNEFIDKRFNLNSTAPDDALYRRVTHVDDPVPLLPLEEWGYRMHAGEVYISKPSLPFTRNDLVHCTGDEDPHCITGDISAEDIKGAALTDGNTADAQGMWRIPPRYHLWQLFFAHRDYFWRLGLCVPGGDPWDWNRSKESVNPDEDL